MDDKKRAEREAMVAKSTVMILEAARRYLGEARLAGDGKAIRRWEAAIRKADKTAAHFGREAASP
jgi:hypothetical protein